MKTAIPPLLHKFRAVPWTRRTFAVAAVWVLLVSFFLVIGVSAFVYYWYPRRAVSLLEGEFSPKKFSEADFQSLKKLLENREAQFNATATIAIPPAFR